MDRQGNWSATSHTGIYIPRRSYTITFNGNGGSVIGPGTLTVTHGAVPTCTTSAFASGWTFTGWCTVENGAYKNLIIEPSLRPVGDGTYFNESGQWMGTQDLTLYARWEKIPDPDYSSVTVVFHKNEPGSSTDVSYSRVYTERVAGQHFANDMAWFVTGYELTDWLESGTNTHYPILCGVSDAWIVARNKQTVHLYAQWTPKTYQIAFDYHMPGGQSLPGNAEMVRAVTYRGSVGILPKPTAVGYTFKGWYKEEGK